MVLRKFLGVSLIALAAMTSPALAQEADAEAQQGHSDDADTDFHQHDEIIVTAPYLERLELLAGTSALSGEELAMQARGQLGDSLTSLPGVSATSFTPGASRPVLRGFQGNRVAILTDGIGNIDVSNTSADHAVTIESLTTDRIEVLRGPAVLLFGGQAVGGAVNAIDKRIPRKVPDGTVHIDGIAGYGSAANERSAGSAADLRASDRFVLHLDGSYRKNDDLRIGGALLAPSLQAEVLALADEEESEGHLEEATELRDLASTRGTLPNSAGESWTFGTGAAFIDDGGNLGVSFGIYDTSYGIPTRPGAGHAHEAGGEEEGPVTIGLRQYRADLRGEVELGKGFLEKLTFRGGFADYSHTEFEGSEIGTIFNSQGIEFRTELAQNKRGGWRGATGLQYLSRDFEAIGAEAFVPPNRTRQIGLFTLQEFQLGGLHLEGALRYDGVSQEAQTLSIKRNFTNISGALGISWLTEGGIKFGANMSRTGRAPSSEELFSNGPHIATSAYEIGDPTLASERSWNGELYARFDGDRIKASLTFFANRFDNFIYDTETGTDIDGLPIFQYFQRDARFWGAEADVSARIATFNHIDIIIDGVADFTHARISGGGGSVPRIPPLRLLGGLELQSAALDVRGEVERSMRQNRIASFETATGGFTLVNASLTWRPLGRKGGVSILASANNIFDTTARRAASFTKDFVPLSGRDIRLAVRFSF